MTMAKSKNNTKSYKKRQKNNWRKTTTENMFLYAVLFMNDFVDFVNIQWLDFII